LIVGGAKMSKSLRIVFKKEKRKCETYGMTETVTHIAAKKSRGGRFFDFT
jgi:long-subunit acyl-CoA synthetase (AMP-forming)